MSDLLSPIYVVFDADEGDAFWGLVGVMKMMVSPPHFFFSTFKTTFIAKNENGLNG